MKNLTIFKFEPANPTCCNTSQQCGQTSASCCAHQCCDILCWNIVIVWLGLVTVYSVLLLIGLQSYCKANRFVWLGKNQSPASRQVKCRVYIIKANLHDGLKVLILFSRVKYNILHSKIKFISSGPACNILIFSISLPRWYFSPLKSFRPCQHGKSLSDKVKRDCS